MDKYDPDKKVAMAVDEWGIWVDNEPETALGSLYQQNTMRSALYAVLMLHMFHKYADRIQIANLAQTINVLQAILLTEGDEMVRTPTYHVFDLLKGHQDGVFIPAEWESKPETIQNDLPCIDISSSVKDRKLPSIPAFPIEDISIMNPLYSAMEQPGDGVVNRYHK